MNKPATSLAITYTAKVSRAFGDTEVDRNLWIDSVIEDETDFIIAQVTDLDKNFKQGVKKLLRNRIRVA